MLWFFLGPAPHAFALLPAIVLLCLLEAVFVQAARYSWGGPNADESRNVDPQVENGERLLRK